MTDATFEIETVRGRLSEEQGGRLLDFWSRHGALEGAAARERLPEVVCLLRSGDGEIAGVNSVYPAQVLLVGRPFWVYRSFLLPEAVGVRAEMFNAAFAALAEEFERTREGPLGLCLPVTDRAEMVRRPEPIWPDTGLMFAGYDQNDTQLRIRYFYDARIEPGLPNSPTLTEAQAVDYSIGDRFRVEPWSDTSVVTPEDVLTLWQREGAMVEAEARRRVDEVLNVVIERDEGLVALSTAYLQRSQQLRMDLWYFRTYVASAYRQGHVATQLTFHNRDLLEERFVRGEDTRASGVAFELEHEGMRKYYNHAVWLPADFVFIGDNQQGIPLRVHYFAGAQVPVPA
jgi:hypothetical protein